MANDFLIVVDMQNDFVSGSLGTPEAQAIVGAVAQRAEEFEGTVVFTKDTHDEDYLQTQEGAKLPRHPLRSRHTRLGASRRARANPAYARCPGL